MDELARILRYLHGRVPMTSQAEHDEIAASIDGITAPAAPSPEVTPTQEQES